MVISDERTAPETQTFSFGRLVRPVDRQQGQEVTEEYLIKESGHTATEYTKPPPHGSQVFKDEAQVESASA